MEYIGKQIKLFNDPRLSKSFLEINEQQVKCKFCLCILKSKLRTFIAHRKAFRKAFV